MNPETALLIAAATGVFALFGSLGSQIINARANLRAKRMELVYERKLDAYKTLIEKAIALADEMTSDEKYSEFYQAFLGATPVASTPVFDAIANTETGLYHLAKRAHKVKTDDGPNPALDLYSEAIDEVALAVRKDLRRFSGG
jgi:hypothetical protein